MKYTNRCLAGTNSKAKNVFRYLMSVLEKSPLCYNLFILGSHQYIFKVS